MRSSKPPCTHELWSAITTRIGASTHPCPTQLRAFTHHQGGSLSSSEALQSGALCASPSEACSTPSSTALHLQQPCQQAQHDTPSCAPASTHGLPCTPGPSSAAPHTTLASLLRHSLHPSSSSSSSWSSGSSLPASMQGPMSFSLAAQSATHSSPFPLHSSTTCGASSHGFATITKTGVPKPRPEVEQILSTHHGGHLARAISLVESLPELAQLVEEHKGKLAPVHITLTAQKLYRLVVINKSARAAALHVQLIAHTLEQAACKQAMWMTAHHVGGLVRNLTDVNYKLQNESLTLLAAMLTMENCQRLHCEDSNVWRDVAYGFAMQGFQNQVFWDALSLHAIEHLPKWPGWRVASFLKQVTIMVDRPREEFVEAAAAQLEKKAHAVFKRDLTDALYALAKLVDIPLHYQITQTFPQGRLGPSNSTTANNASRKSSSSGRGSREEGLSGNKGALQAPSTSSSAAAKTAAAAAPPEPYSPQLVSLLRDRLVVRLRDEALQSSEGHGWDGRSLPLFASSLARLNAWDHRTRASIVAIVTSKWWWKRGEVIQPMYIIKLAKAAEMMDIVNDQFYAALMKHALHSIHHASAQVQMQLLQTFQSIPRAASQDIAKELEQKAAVLSKNTLVRKKRGKAWIVGDMEW